VGLYSLERPENTAKIRFSEFLLVEAAF
jgi:hypothetical protein